MKRSKTPSYVLSLPLIVSSQNERTLLDRFELSRRVYNAVLGEALRRLEPMRNSPEWQAANNLPKKVKSKTNPSEEVLNKERQEAFKKVNDKYGFTLVSLRQYGNDCRKNAKWTSRIFSQECQVTCERAFATAQKYCFGQIGKPKFKGRGQNTSVEGQANKSIVWDASSNTLIWDNSRTTTKQVHLKAIINPKDKDKWQAAALAALLVVSIGG